MQLGELNQREQSWRSLQRKSVLQVVADALCIALGPANETGSTRAEAYVLLAKTSYSDALTALPT